MNEHPNGRRLAACVAILLMSAALHAQVAKKLAGTQLKSAAQPEIKVVKAELAAHKQALFDTLHFVELSLAWAGVDDAEDVIIALASALDAFQAAVHGTIDDATAAIRAAAHDKLGQLAALEPLHGQFPEGFVDGDGGTLDKLLAQVDAPLDALYVSVNRRLDKLEAKAEVAGFGLLAWAGRPRPARRGCVSDMDQLVVSTPLRIDVLVSISRLDAAFDGVLFCGGRARVGSAHVDVYCVAADGGLSSIHAPNHVADPETARFKVYINDGGLGLAEGNYGVYANEENDGSENAVFGLR